MINRANYEIWFLDYMEGNLSEEHCRMVEDFCFENPDLAEELEGKIPILKPDEKATSPLSFKSHLKRHEEIPKVNLENFEYFFALQEKNEDVLRFVKQYPEYEGEFKKYLKIKLEADPRIQADKEFLKDFIAIQAGLYEEQEWIEEVESFPKHKVRLNALHLKWDKASLYEIPQKGKQKFPWWRVAAVFCLFALFSFSYWMFANNTHKPIKANYSPKGLNKEGISLEESENLAFEFYQIKNISEEVNNGEGFKKFSDLSHRNYSSSNGLAKDSLEKAKVRKLFPEVKSNTHQIANHLDTLFRNQPANKITMEKSDEIAAVPSSGTRDLDWKDILVKGAEKVTGKEVAYEETQPNDSEKRWSLKVGGFGIERVKD